MKYIAFTGPDFTTAIERETLARTTSLRRLFIYAGSQVDEQTSERRSAGQCFSLDGRREVRPRERDVLHPVGCEDIAEQYVRVELGPLFGPANSTAERRRGTYRELGVLERPTLTVHLPASTEPRSDPWSDHLIGHVRARAQVRGRGAERGGEFLGVVEEEGAQVVGALLRNTQELM